MAFSLHPRLEARTHLLGITKGCQILLKKKAAQLTFRFTEASV